MFLLLLFTFDVKAGGLQGSAAWEQRSSHGLLGVWGTMLQPRSEEHGWESQVPACAEPFWAKSSGSSFQKQQS